MDNKAKIILMILFVYVASAVTSLLFTSELSHSGGSSVTAPAASPASVNVNYILYIIIAFTIFIIAIRWKKVAFKKILEYYIVFQIVVSALFITYIYGAIIFLPNVLTIILILIIIITLLAYTKFKYRFFNYFGIAIAIFTNVVIGTQQSLLTCAIILTVVAVFDYIAVIRSATMMNIVKFYIGDGNPLPVLITTQDARNLASRINNPVADPQENKNYALGLGDLVIPALFFVSAFTGGYYFVGLAALAGAMVGSVFNLWLVDTYKRAIPAIPAIAFFELLLGALMFFH